MKYIKSKNKIIITKYIKVVRRKNIKNEYYKNTLMRVS